MQRNKTLLAVVEDDNLISSRAPRNLAAFAHALVRFLNANVR